MSFALPRPLRRALTVGASTAAVLALATAPVLADALEQVPGDALAVVRMKSAKGFSDKVAAFQKQLGVDQMLNGGGDPMTNLKQELGISKGFREDGDVAVGLFAVDPSKAGQEGQPEDDTPVQPMLVVPVSDYAEFLSNFPDAETDGDVSTVELGQAGDIYYVARRGDYAVMSTVRDLAADGVTKPVAFEGMAADQMKARDLVLLANLPQLRETLLPALNDNREKILDRVGQKVDEEAMNNKDLATYKPVIRAAVSQGLNVAEAFLRDARGAVVGLDLDDAGVHSTVLAEFTGDSYLGGVFGPLEGTGESLLKGLPAGEYLAFGGSALPPDAVLKVFKDLTGPIVDEVEKVDDAKGKQVLAFVDAAQKAIGASEGTSFGFLAPSKMFGQSAILQTVQITRGDVGALKQATRDMLEKQQEVMGLFAAGQGKMTVDYQENAETVAGVSFDAIKVDTVGGGPEAQQQQQMMSILYGPEGQRTLVGEAGDVLLTVTGLEEATIATAVESAKADQDSLTDMIGMDATTGALPDKPLMVVYVPLDKWATAGVKVAGPMVPFQVQLPANLPPIGTAVTSEGASLKVDTFVPTKLLQALVTAGMQAQQQMNGGGGQPQGGL